MGTIILLLALCLSSASAVPSRIIGGDVTTIAQYPHMVSVLNSWDGGSTFMHNCGGTIINTRSILTAAHCTFVVSPARLRARAGSTYASNGGTVYHIIDIVMHPQFDQLAYLDSDLSIIRTAIAITYINNAVQPGTFAGTNYDTGDNAVVWAAGWGYITPSGPVSEELRHVQLWTVNQEVCRERFLAGWMGLRITDNMLCAGWLDVGGRDQCSHDSGSPLYHNGVVVGVCSFGQGCASPSIPGANVRVSRFITWIQANA